MWALMPFGRRAVHCILETPLADPELRAFACMCAGHKKGRGYRGLTWQNELSAWWMIYQHYGMIHQHTVFLWVR
jgi:hypothetical protein